MKHSGKSSDLLFTIGVIVAVGIVLTGIVIFSNGRPSTPLAKTGSLKIGDSAPSFELASATGGKVTLNQYDGKPVLLYFNEGVGCQPCWKQIIDLENNESFSSLKIPMVAIAPNDPSDWSPVVSNNPMQTPILADIENAVSKSYGMLTMKSSMHKGVNPGHTFILLDAEHKVTWIGDYPGMNMTASEIVTVIKDKIRG
ncbi:MAG: redoxin domain-containing protein [Candidatus Berkelbacteria bacterium]|nr:MAG: redoxin domain-containing protein [Candidatus Berkelbacteria bacterium]QQG51964.1 MAG: redoxin domain-containing protein [Candidatus Berkelbacteria bacterium]